MGMAIHEVRTRHRLAGTEDNTSVQYLAGVVARGLKPPSAASVASVNLCPNVPSPDRHHALLDCGCSVHDAYTWYHPSSRFLNAAALHPLPCVCPFPWVRELTAPAGVSTVSSTDCMKLCISSEVPVKSPHDSTRTNGSATVRPGLTGTHIESGRLLGS
eukprot:2600066-Rhodomonas_salina.1